MVFLVTPEEPELFSSVNVSVIEFVEEVDSVDNVSDIVVKSGLDFAVECVLSGDVVIDSEFNPVERAIAVVCVPIVDVLGILSTVDVSVQETGTEVISVWGSDIVINEEVWEL